MLLPRNTKRTKHCSSP